MFKSIAFIAILCIATASAGLIQTHHVVEPVLAKVGEVVHSHPSAVSHQSITRVHNKAVVQDVVAPVLHAVPVVHAAPVVHTVHAAPVLHTVHAAPVVHTAQVLHAAPVVHSVVHAAPLVHSTSVVHSAPLVHSVHSAPLVKALYH